MKLSSVIVRLRAQAASFSNRVAGAGELAAALDAEESLAVPHAFVIPAADIVSESLSAGRIDQKVEERIVVMVCVDNTTDDRGQSGSESMHDLRAELIAALVGWEPATDYGQMSYRGGQVFDMTRSRLWYFFEFSAVIILGET